MPASARAAPAAKAQLQGDQIDPEDRLGHGVFDLQARVGLEEPEPAPIVDQHLDRREPPQAHGAAHRHGRRPDPIPDGRIGREGRARGDLDDLLVALLQAALPIEQVHDPAPVPRQLDLDVARALDEALEVHAAVTERGVDLGRRRCERRGDLGGAADDADPPPAAARDGLDREGAGRGERGEEGFGLPQGGLPLGSREDGNARIARQPARRALVSERRHRLGGRPHEREARLAHRAREARVLRQEP